MKKLICLVILCAAGGVALVQATPPADLPNPKLTPGDTYTTDANVACAAHTGSETDSIRNVTAADKKAVFEAYGIPGGNHTGICGVTPKGCEVDHLISAKLGGSDSLKNLWPQPYGGKKRNAIMKDNLEKRLIARVCRTSKLHPTKLDLKQAQHDIATDWVAAYQKYVVENQ